jgi:hypothetical protein
MTKKRNGPITTLPIFRCLIIKMCYVLIMTPKLLQNRLRKHKFKQIFEPMKNLKSLIRPFEFGGVTHSIRYTNWRLGKFFFNFNDKVSREEHKTIYSGFWPLGYGFFQSK